MKKFLISIDTEGDNLWKWQVGDIVTTENAKYLPRFQSLCEKYGFKPTYLTNYEMAMDSFFIEYFKKRTLAGQCEIGMHLHAWNSPPDYDLPVRSDVKPGAPYLIEYPEDIMHQKIEFMTDLIENTFDFHPISHRAGRWATDARYFDILNQFGYRIDCSVTPGMDWRYAAGQSPDSAGSDYSHSPLYPYQIPNTEIIEIPVSIRENHRNRAGRDAGFRRRLKKYMEAKKGYGPLWLRPRPGETNPEDLLYLTDVIANDSKSDYLMFMLHSSELMPGGSPNFDTEEAVEKLYDTLNKLFEKISKLYRGVTFREYYKEMKQNGSI